MESLESLESLESAERVAWRARRLCLCLPQSKAGLSPPPLLLRQAAAKQAAGRKKGNREKEEEEEATCWCGTRLLLPGRSRCFKASR